MPWTVATTSTPLWADHQRSFKKGLVVKGATFKVDQVSVDGGLDMGKTSSVDYMRKSDGATVNGDGWLELKNCTPEAPALELISENDAVAFLRQLRDALDVVLGS